MPTSLLIASFPPHIPKLNRRLEQPSMQHPGQQICRVELALPALRPELLVFSGTRSAAPSGNPARSVTVNSSLSVQDASPVCSILVRALSLNPWP